ncbi:hypothetical protein H8B09_02075 [Paenibacillus sp. PR3]|uniref:YugN-like family protein n=1 Tax=Paenibacillus terricola TaxID=2763503 RepID=A0ABR8MRI4_9BACL|nr:YugN family protein [Paenibacillus terricola]MBD3917527.1 hypothetical protein [Paenibacillus terricola]
MITLQSDIESREYEFAEAKEKLSNAQFSLGGNWEYDRGSFDRALDDSHKVWLRLPFVATVGSIDSERADNNATIRIGQPYVLRHLYQEGNDQEASVRVVGSLFDQFQSPTDPDANIDPKWIDKAKDVLAEAERELLS